MTARRPLVLVNGAPAELPAADHAAGGRAPRIGSNGGTTSGTITPDWDAHDQFNFTGLTGGITIAAPAGTPTDGQKLLLRFKDNGTGRSLTFNAAFRAIGVTLPATTVASKTLYVGAIWNAADSKADVVAVGQEA